MATLAEIPVDIVIVADMLKPALASVALVTVPLVVDPITILGSSLSNFRLQLSGSAVSSDPR